MSRTIVGLDIGSSGIRAAEFTTGRRLPARRRFATVPLPPGAVRFGAVADVEAVAEAVAGFDTKTVALGLANAGVLQNAVRRPRRAGGWRAMNLRTLGATKILGVPGLLVTAASSWLLVVGPATAALSDVRLGVTTTRDQSDVLEAQLIALNRQAEQLDEARAAGAMLAEKFPPTEDQPGVLREITAAAAGAGIGPQNLTSLTPTPPVIGGADPATGAPLEVDGSNLARQTVTVVVEGSYDETQRLLETLEQMPRTFLITSVSLARGSTDGACATTVIADMFVMPPIQDPATTKDNSTSVEE